MQSVKKFIFIKKNIERKKQSKDMPVRMARPKEGTAKAKMKEMKQINKRCEAAICDFCEKGLFQLIVDLEWWLYEL